MCVCVCTHIHTHTHASINMWRYGTFYFYINICVVVFVFRFIEVGLEGCLHMLMLCVCCRVGHRMYWICMLVGCLTLQQISQGILCCGFPFSMRGDHISRSLHSRKVDLELYIPCTICVFVGSPFRCLACLSSI